MMDEFNQTDDEIYAKGEIKMKGPIDMVKTKALLEVLILRFKLTIKDTGDRIEVYQGDLLIASMDFKEDDFI